MLANPSKPHTDRELDVDKDRKRRTLESLLDVDGFFGTRLKVRDSAFCLAERHCSLGRNHSLVLFDIDFVA